MFESLIEPKVHWTLVFVRLRVSFVLLLLLLLLLLSLLLLLLWLVAAVDQFR